MRGGQMETPARGQAQPGQDGRFATAAGISDTITKHVRMKSFALAIWRWMAAFVARWAA